MYFYNTLTEKKEKLEKPRSRPLRLFVCGPTVYDYAHIGHARTYLAFDIIVRYLKSMGWNVFYLQNITDVDDKIIQRAGEKNENPFRFARFFENNYYQDIKKLKINSVTKYARASDFIPQIVKQVSILIKKGFAYEIKNSGWYFDISKFKDYGKLAKRTVLQAEDGISRIDEEVNKRNKGDFALWKFVKTRTNADSTRTNADFNNKGVKKSGKKFSAKLINGEPAWNTPLGWGRPGWHIEDTAITEYFFGPQYDLHGGGMDLKFPHHEAEIAQQESASGKKPFVKFWLHTGFLLINGQKMSKSLGNFITIRDFLKKHEPLTLRWLILNHHYRSPINISAQLIEQTEKSIQTIKEFLEKLRFIAKNQCLSNIQKAQSLTQALIQKTEKAFHKAMEDDFNTGEAIATIFKFINEVNKSIWVLSKKQALASYQFTHNILKIFGVELKIHSMPQKILKIAKKRDLSRSNKQFIQADNLRKELKQLGYEIEDTPIGSFIIKS